MFLLLHFDRSIFVRVVEISFLNDILHDFIFIVSGAKEKKRTVCRHASIQNERLLLVP